MSLVSWPIYGCKASAIIPLVKAESGKYAIGDTIYSFNLFGKGTGLKIPKPSDSSTKDTYLSIESTQQQTVRIKLNPTTITIAGDTATVEDGSGDSTATYPEVTIVAGDAPTIKVGTAEATKATIKQMIDFMTAAQSNPVAIMQHLGDTGDGSIGVAYLIAKLTSDIELNPDSKSFEGFTQTFTGCSVALDDAFALPAVSITPFKSGTAFSLPALAATSAKDLTSGKVQII